MRFIQYALRKEFPLAKAIDMRGAAYDNLKYFIKSLGEPDKSCSRISKDGEKLYDHHVYRCDLGTFRLTKVTDFHNTKSPLKFHSIYVFSPTTEQFQSLLGRLGISQARQDLEYRFWGEKV